MDDILRCENIYKKFGKKQILKDISFNLKEGDILAFIGPNGSGKTTTIKLILGLQSITSGKVFINGNSIEKDFVKAIKQVGSIVENPDFYMYLSGYDNLKLAANLYDISDERIDEVVKIIKLEKRIKDKVSKYSLGMRQRLGIGQAILHNPNLLVLDEPTNGLDPEGIKELRDLLKDLSKNEHMAIFISSHNLAELESFCNKVCIIKNGSIIETTSVKDLKKINIESYYIIETDQNEKAINVIGESASLNDDAIRVKLEKEEVAEMVKKLVKADINIYSVYEEKISLEDAFLKKTGGNIID